MLIRPIIRHYQVETINLSDVRACVSICVHTNVVWSAESPHFALGGVEPLHEGDQSVVDHLQRGLALRQQVDRPAQRRLPGPRRRIKTQGGGGGQPGGGEMWTAWENAVG